MSIEGFIKGKASPFIFYHMERNIRIVVHGDDFTVLGHSEDLDWFRERIIKRFDVKFRGRLGPSVKDEKVMRILNRVVEWEADRGIVSRADKKHAEIVAKRMVLELDSNGVNVPCSKDKVDEFDDEELKGAIAARANYLAMDRPDPQFSVKEVCRSMSSPKADD